MRLDFALARCCNCSDMFQTPDSDPPTLVQETADAARGMVARVAEWLEADVLTANAAIEAAALVLIAIAAFYAGRYGAPAIERLVARDGVTLWLRVRLTRLAKLVGPVTALLLIWFAAAVARATGVDPTILGIAGKLLLAWVIIRVLTAVTRESALTKLFGALVWLVAALAILGWLDPLVEAMDAASLTAGETRFSMLTVVNALLLIGVLLWLAGLISGLVEGQLRRVEGVTPATRVLMGKIARITLITVAILVGLTSVGIDFTAIAVFSGAVGVGIGFGLQKVVSNLISGMILLLDRSIKPGDVIEIGQAYGWISKLGARYVAVVTRDGVEYLIPNEDLITQQVVNWSFSDRAVRLKVGVGVSYRSDVRKALDLMLQAGKEHDRVLESPPPATRLVEFGDSSVNLELRVWIEDPEGGVVNVASDIRLRVWDLFHENGIEFPFPQRDLHIASAEGLEGFAKELRGGREGTS